MAAMKITITVRGANGIITWGAAMVNWGMRNIA
jgi:hypothetical protein